MVSPTGVIATEWTLFILAVALVCTRVTVHIRMRNQTLYLSDTFLVLAMISALGLLVCDTLTYKAGSMSNFTEPTTAIRKVRFATNYFFDFGIYLPKFSMLAFFHRIVPRTAPVTWKALWAITAFIGMSSMTVLLADTFWCGPDPAVNWSNAMTECTVFTSMALTKINWSLHFISEILIFVLPLPLISGLSLNQKREKAGLLVVFLLGAVTILVTTGRFIAMVILSNDIRIYIMATAEFTIAIIILSLISLRPLLRKIGHVMSSLSGSGSPFSESMKDPSSRTLGGTRTGRSRRSTALPMSAKGSRNPNLYPSQMLSSATYGSEIELTEQGLGRIYKTEEVIVTHSRASHDPDAVSDRSRDHGSHESEIRVNSMAV